MVWYYADGSNQRGPVSDEEFDDLVARGRVRDETLVWQDGMPDWCSLSQAKIDGFVKEQTGTPLPPPASAGVPPPPHGPTAYDFSTTQCTNCRRSFSEHELAQFANITICSTCQPQLIEAVQQATGSSSSTGTATASNKSVATTTPGRILPRFVARLIDNFFISLLAVLTYFMFFDTSSLQAGVAPDMASPEMRPLLLMWVAFEAVYHAVFLAAMATTPGKMLLRLRVVHENGGRISIPQSVVRAFSLAMLQAVSLLLGESTLSLVATLAQIACFATALYNPHRRTAFDYLANTRVVKA